MSDSKSSRRRSDTGLPLGYVPPPPGASDPFDDPGQYSASNAQESFVEDAPFEDELAGPSPVMVNATPLPPPSTDPRELARRLAEEARARATASTQAVPEPAPPAPTPPAKKKSLLDRAPAPKAAAPAPKAAEPAPPPPEPVAAAPAAPATPVVEEKKRSLADRARRPVSAAEALRLAAEAEKDTAVPKKAKATEPVPAPAAARPKPRKAAAPAPVEPAAPQHAVGDVVSRFLAGASVQREVPVANPVVFRALWTAHRARASAMRDLGLLVTASVLLDAVERLPKGNLVAAQATVADRDVALWVDVGRGVVLAVAEPSEIYLAGL